MEALAEFLLENVIDWSQLSSNRKVFDNDLITIEIFRQYLYKWRLDDLFENQSFLRRLDVNYLEIILTRLGTDRLNWGRFSKNLSLVPSIDQDFIDKHKNFIDWSDTDLHNHPIMTPELFDRYKDKWNWRRLSINIMNIKLLNNDFFLAYADKWDYYALDYAKLFNKLTISYQFFINVNNKDDRDDGAWPWDHKPFVNALLNTKMVDSEFKNLTSCKLKDNPQLFKLQVLDRELFNCLYSNNKNNDSLPTDTSDQLKWREYSKSKKIFLHPEMNADYFLSHLNDWNIRNLANNIYFWNHPMMNIELFVNIHKGIDDNQEWWKWLSRSQVLFSSLIMSKKLFRGCRDKWNWKWLSSNEKLFQSELIDENLFCQFDDRWHWSLLSTNMSLFKSKLMTPGLFRRYDGRSSKMMKHCWDWDRMKHNGKIYRIARNIINHSCYYWS